VLAPADVLFEREIGREGVVAATVLDESETHKLLFFLQDAAIEHMASHLGLQARQKASSERLNEDDLPHVKLFNLSLLAHALAENKLVLVLRLCVRALLIILWRLGEPADIDARDIDFPRLIVAIDLAMAAKLLII